MWCLFPYLLLRAASNSIGNFAVRSKMESKEVKHCLPIQSWIQNEIQTLRLYPIFSANQTLSPPLLSAPSVSLSFPLSLSHSHTLFMCFSLIWSSPDPRRLCISHLSEFIFLSIHSLFPTISACPDPLHPLKPYQNPPLPWACPCSSQVKISLPPPVLILPHYLFFMGSLVLKLLHVSPLN